MRKFIFVVFAALAAWGVVVHADEAGPALFASEQAAVDALVKAAKANDDAALKTIYGSAVADLISDGKDPVVAANRREFAKAVAEKLVFEKLENGKVEIVVGKEAWPFPILLVPKDGKWFFDAEEGKEEILARRIGRNELEAIEILDVFVDAQIEYAAKDRDGDKVREYAQQILSTKGKKDGLWWPADVAKGEELSPMGPAVISLAESFEAVQGGDKKIPFNGYYWKILKAQGPSAPGGAHTYVLNGNMIAGFALVGVPAKYRNTGVMTFIVSHHGDMYEKDLGEKSIETVKAMEAFDPGEGWKVIEAEEDEAE